MYPTLIIVLVAARLAILERSINSVASCSDLRFAVAVRGQGDDDNALSPHQTRVESAEQECRTGVHRRLEVSFGPSIELTSVVVAGREDERHRAHVQTGTDAVEEK